MTSEPDWMQRIASSPAIDRLMELVDAGGAVSARGAVGSSAVVTAAAIARRSSSPLLLVTAHLDDADEALDELEAAGLTAARLPALEQLPGETSVSIHRRSSAPNVRPNRESKSSFKPCLNAYPVSACPAPALPPTPAD